MWKRANAVLVLSALLVACTSTSNDQDAAAPSEPAATASDPPEDAAMLETEGAFDRAAGETLTLNPATDARLHGRVLAELGFETSAIAVASDGALGVLRGTTLAILLDGREIATRNVVTPPIGGPLGSRAMAFDTDGTLWAWTEDAVVGFRRDGETTDIGAGLPDFGTADGVGRLRVTGTDVSLVTYGSWSDWAESVPVGGQDPLAGRRTVDQIPVGDLPTVTEPDAEPSVVVYDNGPGIEFGPGCLSSSSIMGTSLVLWDNQPLSDGEGSALLRQSQVVADSVATLAWVSVYDGNFLVVHRGDGAAVAALVDGGPYDEVSVSPDGAVHLIVHRDGTTTVRTVLTADLRPVDDKASSDSAAVGVPRHRDDAGGPADDDACRGGDDDRRLGGLDLDEEGLEDSARLHATAGRLLLCLGNGQTTDLAAWSWSRWTGIEAVDLGGQPAVALVRAPGGAAAPLAAGDAREAVFVRWVDGAFGAVGADRPEQSGSVAMSSTYEETANLYPHMEVARIAYGCRPSTFVDPVTSTEAEFDVARLVVHDAEEQDPTRPGVEVTFFLEFDAVAGLSVFSGSVESPYIVQGNHLDLALFPDLTQEADLQQLLGDLGFTARCLSEE